jgi:hypothetical protein
MRSLSLLALVFLSGCSHQPTETYAQQQKGVFAQMAAKDDAYCKQQKAQPYADCRNVRQSMHNFQCLGCN